MPCWRTRTAPSPTCRRLLQSTTALAHKDAVLADKDRTLAHLQTTLAEHDVALAHKDAVLADKDQPSAHLQATLQEHAAALAQRNNDLTIQRFALEDKDRLITTYEAERRTFGAKSAGGSHVSAMHGRHRPHRRVRCLG